MDKGSQLVAQSSQLELKKDKNKKQVVKSRKNNSIHSRLAQQQLQSHLGIAVRVCAGRPVCHWFVCNIGTGTGIDGA